MTELLPDLSGNVMFAFGAWMLISFLGGDPNWKSPRMTVAMGTLYVVSGFVVTRFS